jgi:hypothetical protein
MPYKTENMQKMFAKMKSESWFKSKVSFGAFILSLVLAFTVGRMHPTLSAIFLCISALCLFFFGAFMYQYYIALLE